MLKGGRGQEGSRGRQAVPGSGQGLQGLAWEALLPVCQGCRQPEHGHTGVCWVMSLWPRCPPPVPAGLAAPARPAGGAMRWRR